MKHFIFLVNVLALGFSFSFSAQAIDVAISSNYGEAFPVGATITFSAAATNVTPVTTYTWDFDDGSPAATTSVPTIDHVFALADIYAVTVTVNNGTDLPASDFDFFEAFDPPAPTDPLGTNDGDPPATNPDDGFTFTLNRSQAGYIDGALSLDAAHTGAGDAFSTDFGDGVSGRNGAILLHRYTGPGIFILESEHTQGGSPVGKLRKTLVFSETEILGSNSDPEVIDPPLSQRRLAFKSFKGKFNFAANAAPVKATRMASLNDTVTVTWSMTLPAGFDVESQVVDLAIGNVMESIELTRNGVGVITQPSAFKSVRFKFPRLKKGQTRPAAAVPSRVTVQMSSQDLPTQGFDTEGITTRQFQTTGTKGPFARSIQVATVFAGVSYSGVASVALNIRSNGDFGTISGRSK